MLGLTLGLFVLPVQLWLALAPRSVLRDHVEARSLAAAALLALALPLVQIVLQVRELGGPAVRGNRVGFPAEAGAGGRIGRAHRNLVEGLVPFAAAVSAAQALGVSNAQTVGAAALFLVARLAHAISYAAGVTVLRSAAFYAGLIATTILALQLPLLR